MYMYVYLRTWDCLRERERERVSKKKANRWREGQATKGKEKN